MKTLHLRKMMNRLLQIIGRILCFLGIHKMKKGKRYGISAISCTKERYDECACDYCVYGYWRKDEEFYNTQRLKEQMRKETRRVLVQKYTENRALKYYLDENNWAEITKFKNLSGI